MDIFKSQVASGKGTAASTLACISADHTVGVRFQLRSSRRRQVEHGPLRSTSAVVVLVFDAHDGFKSMCANAANASK